MSHVAQFLFDANQLVVFGHSVSTAQRSRLNLAGVGGYGNVGNGGVLCLARTVGGDGGVAMTVCHLDGIKGLPVVATIPKINESAFIDFGYTFLLNWVQQRSIVPFFRAKKQLYLHKVA